MEISILTELYDLDFLLDTFLLIFPSYHLFTSLGKGGESMALNPSLQKHACGGFSMVS